MLDPWQETVLQAAMGERSDGTWAAKQVGLSAPRQNGKSQLIVARALAGVLLFGETKIVVSAYAQDAARQTFEKLLDQIDNSDALAERVAPRGVMNAINREQVKFTNGAVIQFKARTVSGTRGFSCDCLLLDEAQILGMPAWVSINSTMSARPNPQVWLLGTPPTPEDNGEVYASVRDAALRGVSHALAWLEWAVDPASPEYVAAVDALQHKVWTPEVEALCATANAAWFTRINHEVVRGEFESYPPDRFALDRLGIWPDADRISRVIMPDEWAATGVPKAPEDGIRSLGIKFSPDGSRVAVAGALKHDGGIHVELVGAHSGSMAAGTASLVAWVAERWSKYAAIVVDGKSNAGAFIEALIEAGVSKRAIVAPTWPEVATANSMIVEAIIQKQATHLATEGQAVLDDSVAHTTKKSQPTGSWSFASTREPGDEAPIAAVALAHWGAKTSKRVPGRKQIVSY